MLAVPFVPPQLLGHYQAYRITRYPLPGIWRKERLTIIWSYPWQPTLSEDYSTDLALSEYLSRKFRNVTKNDWVSQGNDVLILAQIRQLLLEAVQIGSLNNKIKG